MRSRSRQKVVWRKLQGEGGLNRFIDSFGINCGDEGAGALRGNYERIADC
jgi:hypothetical protein